MQKRGENLKFNKLIPKSLILGLFLSSVSFNSFANNALLNERYETFKGDYLTIKDIGQNDNIDIEIEGNTLVNLADSSKLGARYNGELLGDTKFKLRKINGDGLTDVYFNQNIPYKINTTYTLVYNIVSSKGNPTSIYCNYHTPYGLLELKGSELKNGIHTKTFIHDGTIPVSSFQFYHLYAEESNAEIIIKDVMILEGDWSNKELPKYFEGMMSVGEQSQEGYKIDVLSSGKNLFNKNDVEFNKQVIVGDGTMWPSSKYVTSNFIKVKPNTIYNVNEYLPVVVQFDINYNYVSGIDNSYAKQFRTASNCRYIKIRNFIPIDTLEEKQEVIEKAQLEESADLTEYGEFKCNKKNILLKEPLQSVSDNFKDKIIKKNREWYIERNCKKVVLNGSEEWIENTYHTLDNTMIFELRNIENMYNGDVNKTIVLNDKFSSSSINYIRHNDIELISGGYELEKNKFNLRINKDRLVTQDIKGFKQWLSENNITVIYALDTPIYEPLNIDLSIPIYEGITYISNDLTIPATMKVTIDRIINKSNEAIEKAISTPTSYNISSARMWVNQMQESLLKDEMQMRLDGIFSIEDIQLDRKNATLNLDVYIKSENMLSLSLDTNNVIFNDFSGTEDLEELNAVNLTVSSSLPYKINAYLASEIENADKSKTMDKSILNIKANSEQSYSTFNDTVNPVVLLDDQSRGNDIIHGIDLKLKSNIAHQKDVYKTTIKFEVEQK